MASTSRGAAGAREALLKSYNTRLKTDVHSMLDNFESILRLARRDCNMQLSRAAQVEQDNLEMQVRASNFVRAGESLLKLVADLKHIIILNDYYSTNQDIMANDNYNYTTANELDRRLVVMRDQANNDVREFEEEYYMSEYK